MIAPSFGDIFYNNSLNNGLLVIRRRKRGLTACFTTAPPSPSFQLTVDLDQQVVRATDGSFAFAFDIDASRRE